MAKRLVNMIHSKLNDSRAGKRSFHREFDGEEDDGDGEDGKGAVGINVGIEDMQSRYRSDKR